MKECPLLEILEKLNAIHKSMVDGYDNIQHVYGNDLIIMRNLLKKGRNIIRDCEGCDDEVDTHNDPS